MPRNLVNRKNYNTINQSQDKSTQTGNMLEDKVLKIIEYLVGCCCPMPKVETKEPKVKDIRYDNIVSRQPKSQEKQTILREIAEDFSDSSISEDDWVEINKS